MSKEGFVADAPLSYTAGAVIAENLLVTLSSTAGTVDLCGASGFPAGNAADGAASGAAVTVYPMRGRMLVVASDTIAAGNFVKAAAAGQVAPEASVTTLTAFTIGQAETAATVGLKFWMVAKG